MSGETSPPDHNEYNDRADHRRRKPEHLLTAPYGESNNLEALQVHGKAHHPSVEFRISPFARKVGEETAALFGLSLSQYTKALLYQALGLTNESIDRRRKRR